MHNSLETTKRKKTIVRSGNSSDKLARGWWRGDGEMDAKFGGFGYRSENGFVPDADKTQCKRAWNLLFMQI